ncbi:MAG: shikimate dehydrogenase [Flavobacteriales bacterium]|nr:shikimate dehydrogenase [Flavobacteriales bacterium]
MTRYGLIGASLTHSYSPRYFEQKFKGMRSSNFSYVSFELDSINELTQLIEKESLSGFNVTIPFKESIIPFLDEMTPEAQAIGAVNCVKVEEGKMLGYNTDVDGFKGALKEFTGGNTIERAIVLGNGGAAKAILHVLNGLDILYQVVSRKGDKNYENLTASEVRQADLIVNTTPLGMHPDVLTFPDIPYEALTSRHFVMDLVYNPTQTLFLKKADILGARTMNGEHMLALQAEKSWDIWQG